MLEQDRPTFADEDYLLLKACQTGDSYRAMGLLDSGSRSPSATNSNLNLNITSEGGKTPLLWAAHHGHASLTKVLIDYGADITCRTWDGFPPLYRPN